MTVRVPIRTEDKKRIFDVEVLIMGDSFQLKDIRLKQRKNLSFRLRKLTDR